MTETILSGQAWRSEMINRRKDGGLCVDEQIIAPVRDACGTISHFVVIKQDVTERKRMQQALARSEQRSLSSWTAWADS